ncbi:MAG TPA: membrane protein insertion efficiency factor YidD [Aggregatilinea sp.]|jgi:putative membrane protein insertion efficiency factor|uniref:membrane protein insertion efficiency factor YidD n=1 Tax=Aggregatilinea sp. TaxID=2806333 RepID=UPI002C1E8A0B|nr:membrane protein insertion efficiency factor YidD [Aggregatilinea sp.]HML22498.1 membrane protein insertion efficiency factor YidD [Aggregatilinea sp.]
MKYVGLALIRVYQLTFSRLLPPSCRYDPSCSHYTYQAIDKHGLLKGSWLGMKRIARCHPLGPGGHDPVP